LEVKAVKFSLRYIPPGSFLMGSPEDEPGRRSDETQHPVTLTQGYWLGETTVSQQLWQAVMGNNLSSFKSQSDKVLPVESVSWDDCQQFFISINKLLPGGELTFPTEAQWEYACRGGTQTPFSTGAQLTMAQANYNGEYSYNDGEIGVNREKIVAVDMFAPNGWGIKQMHGNLLEWCLDNWREYKLESAINPVGGLDVPRRALRGGGWYDFGSYCRSACRFYFGRDFAARFIGLRLVQVLSTGSEPHSRASVAAEQDQAKNKASDGNSPGFVNKIINKIKGKK
jgi:sulfatase modifying factor 1